MTGSEKPRVLLAGVAGSFVAVAGLILVQARWPGLLDIPSAWLGLAVIPVVVGLVVGGYIRTFKGFGIEVEAALDETVSDDVTAEASQDYDPFADAEEHAGDVTDAEMVLSKASMGRLQSLEPAEKASFQRLSFRQGFSGYHPSAVEEHLRELPQVKWIEIDDASGRFLGIIRRKDLELHDLDRFVGALESASALEQYPSILAAEALDRDTPLRQVALAFKAKDRDALPVTQEGRLLGMVERDKIHQKIGEAVVRSLG